MVRVEINYYILKCEVILRHIVIMTEMDKARLNNRKRKNTQEFSGRGNNRDKEERGTKEKIDSRRGKGFKGDEDN